MNSLIEHEALWRAGIFVVLLTAFAIWELAAPARRTGIPRVIRWGNNFAMVVLDALILRLLFPILAVGVAELATRNGWGLFPALGVSGAFAVIAGVLLLDLAIYGQHVMFHKVPVLWRLHRMHHADPHFDVSTALRFHPVEIVLSMAIKMAVVLAIGLMPLAVVVFEILLSGTALFNHSNARLPRAIEPIVRSFVVTPDMHRVHHSDIRAETDSNYGFCLPWWDRLFGTYTAQPRRGHAGMGIGIGRYGSRRDQWLDRLLVQPFRSGK
ncbi:sterol desaturase family protein [Salibaculum sp.]|uniref:sterol desaturase family protein n=1 Tax=Salibaculum sp. TaxID=2855480 RepID=UPI002B4870C2|nr:sterol desaturase family protein [Salibaculum sp.]HKL68065.1 sterol desaturase family protein [Salibaculum sp.]